MLFQTRFHDPIRRGEVTATFRRWRQPQAKVGGHYRLHTGGVIEVTRVEVVEREAIGAVDVARAGFETFEALFREVDRFPEGDLYRIDFCYAGEMPDERAILAADAALDDGAREEIEARLAKMDGGGRGAWTLDVLRLIGANEGVRAPDLAARVGRETLRFKADVRRLKGLGLTESLEVGYRLSPRGRAFLEAAASGAPAEGGA